MTHTETHAVCNKHNIGGNSVCCECSGKTDCNDMSDDKWERQYDERFGTYKYMAISGCENKTIKDFIRTTLATDRQSEAKKHEDTVKQLPEKWRGKIICGFAGIGKSTLAKKYANVVDLESTPFGKDWDRYAKVARHMAQNGYTVLLSCHKEIREKLHSGYYVAKPRQSDRIEYISRYKARGNNEAFITMMNQNWEKFIELLPHEYGSILGYILVKNNLEETIMNSGAITTLHQQPLDAICDMLDRKLSDYTDHLCPFNDAPQTCDCYRQALEDVRTALGIIK